MLRLNFILYTYAAYSVSLEIENLFRSCRFSRGIIYFLGKKEEKILCCALHLTPHILFLLKSQICFYLADFSVESDIFWKREKERERKDTVLCLIFIFYIYIAYSPSLEIENLFRSCRFFCRIVYFGRGKG